MEEPRRGRPVADLLSDLLRMNKALAACGARQLIKFLACLGIMPLRTEQMCAVAVWLNER